MAWWQWSAWGAGFAAPLVVALLLWLRQLRLRRRDDPVENHRRADNGLPPLADPRLKWYKRVVASPWTWVIVALLVFCAFALWVQYYVVYAGLVVQIVSDLKQAGLPPQYLSQDAFNEGLLGSTGWAALTLAAYVVIFLFFDRWRPTPPSLKLVALAWGACGATFCAIFVNSWAGTLLAGGSTDDPTADAAAAVFVAPFVEEACKATVLFWLVMAMRRRLCSVLQMIGLSGLAAAGFAFVENIIYYTRQYCEASLVPGVDPEAVRKSLVLLRGLDTSFGHPIFTMMTAFGLIVGLRQRSKLARIICPLTGYLVAALLHMCFNGLSSIISDPDVLIRTLVTYGVMVAAVVVFWLVGQCLAQRRVIAWRLDDYVRMGWLRDRDPAVYSGVLTRTKLVVAGWLRGWRIGKATVRLMADITELAYLRQSLVTGTADAGVVGREHELAVDIKALRGIGLDEPVGLRLVPRYRGPAAWHTFQNWRAKRAAARQAAAAAWTAPATWGAPVGV